MVMGIHGIRHKNLNRPHRVTVQAVHQHRIQRQSFVDDIGLADGIVDIDLGRAFVVRRGNLVAGCSLFSCGSGRGQRCWLTCLHCGSKGVLGRARRLLGYILLLGRNRLRWPRVSIKSTRCDPRTNSRLNLSAIVKSYGSRETAIVRKYWTSGAVGLNLRKSIT